MSIPKQPRQQMINIMYLALTALLALNVSSEVLNAFKLINDKLNVSNEAAEAKTASLMGMFQSKYNSNAAKTKPYLADAVLARNMVHDFYTYTEQLKTQLIEESGGVAQGKISGSKNTDVTTRIMIERESGIELERKINELREKLFSLPMLAGLTTEARTRLEREISLSTSYDVLEAEKLDKKSWTNYNFERVPVIAAVTMLAKLQGDAKDAESRILEQLYKGVDAGSYAFEQLSAKVIAPNNYVLANRQQFNANIFFAATSKTQEVEVFVGKFNNGIPLRDANGKLFNQVEDFPLQDGFTQLEVKDGVAQYNELPDRAGDQYREGVIKIKNPEGTGFNYYPFEVNYKAAQPTAIVSPDKINLLYAGIENPLSVSVPGYPAERVRAYLISGNGTINGANGEYSVKMNNVGRAKIKVNVVMEDGKETEMGISEFRVKRTPTPTAQVLGYEGGPIDIATFKVAKELKTVLKDFEFEGVHYKVVGYRMTREHKGEVNDGDATTSVFTPKMLELVAAAQRGDRYYFEYIKAEGPDKIVRNVPEISFKIK